MGKVLLLFCFVYAFNNNQLLAQKIGKNRIDSLKREIKNRKEDTSILSILNEISIDECEISSFDSAKKTILHALEIAQKNNYAKGISNVYHQLGNISLGFSDIQSAKEYYEKSLKINEQIGNDHGSASNLLGLGLVNYYSSDFNKALSFDLKALAINKKIGDKNNIALCLNNIASIYNVLSDFGKSIDYSNKALRIFEELNDKNNIVTILGNIATGYKNISNYPMAMEYHTRAIRLSNELKDSINISYNLHGLGMLCYELSNYSQALGYYEKSLAIDEKTHQKDKVAFNLQAIGDVNIELKNYKIALENYQKALSIFSDINMQYGVACNLSNIGNVYLCTADYQKSIEYYQKSLKISDNIKSNQLTAIIYHNLGESHIKLHEYSKASFYERNGLKLAKEINDLNTLKETYNNLSIIDSALGNYKSALENHKLHMIYSDSIFNMEKDRKITRIQMQYEFDNIKDSIKVAQNQKDAIAIRELQKQKLMRNGLLIGFLIVLLFAIVFFSQRNKINKEKQRSETLLLNILPAEVAEELKVKGEAEAKQIDEVTVLFTDFKGFTQLSEKLSPKELVADIHECFSVFDHIMHKHGVEKIKTIGDAYMAAGGLPIPNKTHAEDVVKAAMEIQQFMHQHKQEREAAGKLFFEIRIGIHTGPVVAGIVGVKKFAYDIWGDTVNTASRMESSGEAGKINISETTYALVKDKFSCTHRGKISAKGKGEVDMYFVT